jgi:hypothetical protein
MLPFPLIHTAVEQVLGQRAGNVNRPGRLEMSSFGSADQLLLSLLEMINDGDVDGRDVI